MIFRFHSPEFLWLLLLIPLVTLLRGRSGQSAALQFSAISLASQIAALVRRKPGRIYLTLRAFSLLFLILALARPQLGQGTSEIQASGIDIVLAVDLSSSMWAHDFAIERKPTDRLTAVKTVMEEFIEKRPNDRIGIIAFAGQPYLISPLTLNHGWLRRNLERLQIGLIEDGTAIGTAIGMAVNRLRALTSKSRIVILLTDGANNSGELTPIAAAEAAAAYKIKIYTIGAGREGMVPFPRLDRNGNLLRDRRGKLVLVQVPSSVDVETLKRVSEIAQARFFRATDTQSLQEIYQEIDQLEKTDVTMIYHSTFTEIYTWPAIAALAFLALEQLLANTRYRRLP